MATTIDACEGCDGSGIRPDSTNHSGLPIPDGFTVIERCDWCERFADDMAAAQAFGVDVREMGAGRVCSTVTIARRK